MPNTTLTLNQWVQIYIGGSSLVDQMVQVTAGHALISLGTPSASTTAIDSSSFDDKVIYVPAATSVYARPNGNQPTTVSWGNFGAGQSAAGYELAAAANAALGVFPSNPLRALTSRNTVLGSTKTGDASHTGATYRFWFQTPLNADVSDLSFTYANWAMTLTGEVAGDNPITVKAYLEYNGVSYPIFFSGAQTVTIAPGASAYNDPLSLTIPRNSIAWVRTFVTSAGTASGTWPLGHAALVISGTYDNNNYAAGTNADLASGTGVISGAAATASYHPIAIYGRLSAMQVVAGILGDSIARGVGDFGQSNSSITSPYMGFLERAFSNTIPWVNGAQSGYKAANIVPPLARIMETFARVGVTTVIDELGVNDLPLGLAALQAAQIQTWGLLKARNIKVLQTTITPSQVNSTDGWTSVANQTSASAPNELVRTSFNDWIRAGAPIVNGAAVAIGTAGALLAGQAGHPLSGFIEIADTVETARNSGKWKVSATARAVADGAITTGTPTLTSNTAAFTAADLGTVVYVAGAGAAGAALIATIQTINSGTSVTLSANAGTTVSGAATGLGAMTIDGLHPATAMHLLMGTPINAALANGQIA